MTKSKSITVKLDEHDLKLIFESICMYDMRNDGYMTSNINDSFHYLYSLSHEVGFNYDEPHLIHYDDDI